MKKKIAVKVGNAFLRQKIYLILKDEWEISLADTERITPDTEVVLCDAVARERYAGGASRVIAIGEGGELLLPFSRDMLCAALGSADSRTTPLSLGERCVYLRGERIALTEMEFALLTRLYLGGGEFVSREILVREVWGEGAYDGILNVYIHYLREKLEGAGEKIILSSRKYGYKIDGKYLMGGGAECLK